MPDNAHYERDWPERKLSIGRYQKRAAFQVVVQRRISPAGIFSWAVQVWLPLRRFGFFIVSGYWHINAR